MNIHEDSFDPHTTSMIKNEPFYTEVLAGLSSNQKHLPSKYFYDKRGDLLFQQIMESPDYYLTRCEMEIFTKHTAELAGMITADTGFDIIELGAGDGTKTVHLLEYLYNAGTEFEYFPIDISSNVLYQLSGFMTSKLPQVKMTPLAGEYLRMLQSAMSISDKPKVVLFLGANIGNLSQSEAVDFCRQIRNLLRTGDRLLIGFDLMKDPRIIKTAYDDTEGITRNFNLNLLRRINSELGANFDLNLFEHYCSYDPETGACKSYLVSLASQSVDFATTTIQFAEGECIWMEVSQKYSMEQINELATISGFYPVSILTDDKGWFADVCWEAR